MPRGRRLFRGYLGYLGARPRHARTRKHRVRTLTVVVVLHGAHVCGGVPSRGGGQIRSGRPRGTAPSPHRRDGANCATESTRRRVTDARRGTSGLPGRRRHDENVADLHAGYGGRLHCRRTLTSRGTDGRPAGRSRRLRTGARRLERTDTTTRPPRRRRRRPYQRTLRPRGREPVATVVCFHDGINNGITYAVPRGIRVQMWRAHVRSVGTRVTIRYYIIHVNIVM